MKLVFTNDEVDNFIVNEVEIDFDFKKYSKKLKDDSIIFPFSISRYFLTVLKQILEKPDGWTQKEKNTLLSSIFQPIWKFLEMNDDFYSKIRVNVSEVFKVCVEQIVMGCQLLGEYEPFREYKEYLFQTHEMCQTFVKHLLYYYQQIYKFKLTIDDETHEIKVGQITDSENGYDFEYEEEYIWFGFSRKTITIKWGKCNVLDSIDFSKTKSTRFLTHDLVADTS